MHVQYSWLFSCPLPPPSLADAEYPLFARGAPKPQAHPSALGLGPLTRSPQRRMDRPGDR